MNLEVEESGPLERKLRVELGAAEVDAAFDAVYRQIQKHARLRGFRPGRAPRAVLERYYSEDAQAQVMERLARESLPKAIEERSLDIVLEPNVEPAGQPKPGTPFQYTATVEVRPTIELRQIRGLAVTRPTLPTPEEDPIEAHLQQLRTQAGTLIEEPAGTPVARGHRVTLDYTATLDGQPLEGGSATGHELELGAGRTLPGLEEELIGMTAGQTKEFDLPVPEETGGPLAGKSPHFSATVTAVKRVELAELDDEFAKDVSEFATLAEFRAELERRVEANKKNELDRLTREVVIDAALESNPFPVPQGLVERQLAGRIARTVRQFGAQLPQDTLEKLVEGWRQDWRPAAERDVRFSFLVGEIARAEKIGWGARSSTNS
jgi:trigger factor